MLLLTSNSNNLESAQISLKLLIASLIQFNLPEN